AWHCRRLRVSIDWGSITLVRLAPLSTGRRDHIHARFEGMCRARITEWELPLHRFRRERSIAGEAARFEGKLFLRKLASKTGVSNREGICRRRSRIGLAASGSGASSAI
ncbi:MAG: hypothetical protein ACXWLR_05605, partial [Myxococcales bacterium]